MHISSPGIVNNEDLAAVQMRDNPAYQEISIISQENEPHIYERVTF